MVNEQTLEASFHGNSGGPPLPCPLIPELLESSLIGREAGGNEEAYKSNYEYVRFVDVCVDGLLLLLLHSPALSLEFTILGDILAYVTGFFFSIHRGSHIPSSWMVHAGCVFVAGIQTSRT